jgi:hypothetical protein
MSLNGCLANGRSKRICAVAREIVYDPLLHLCGAVVTLRPLDVT